MQTPTQCEEASGLLAGRLEGIGIPDLLWSLCGQPRTGLLEVSRDGLVKKIYVQKGRIVFASSSDPNDRLGEMLLRQGRISLDQLEEALARLQTGKRLGTLLVEADSLTPDQLVEAVVFQVKAIVLDLFSWDAGHYEFREGYLPTHEAITLQMHTGELLLEGIRGIQAFGRIRRAVGPSRRVFGLTPGWREACEGLALGEGERLLLDRLERADAGIQELCNEVFLSNFEIYRTLWAFKVLGLVEQREPPALGVPGALEGRLAGDGLPEILVQIARSRETGVLYLSRGSVERGMHFREGRCVFATSSDPDDSLMIFLLRRGVISLQDRNETERRLLSNKRVGTILREMGVLDDDDLREMVRQQIGEIVYDSFRWGTGEYVFVAGPLPSHEEIALEVDVARLVAEGVRRVNSWTRVIRGCGGMDRPLQLSAGYDAVLESMGAGADEREVVRAVQSPQTPRRVCALTELRDFRVCQVLWTLKLLGALELEQVDLESVLPPLEARPAQPEPQSAEPIEPIEPMVTDEVTAGDDHEPDTVTASRREEVAAELRSLPERWNLGADTDTDADADAEPVVVVEPQPAGTVALETEPFAADALGEPVPLDTLDLSDEPVAEVESDWPLPDDVDETISRFNAMHRVVYRALRAEIGAGAVNFVRSCRSHVSRDEVDPLQGVRLFSDGTWDVEGLKRVVVAKRIADPWSLYQRLLDREFVQLQPHLGDTRSEELKRQIWAIDEAHTST